MLAEPIPEGKSGSVAINHAAIQGALPQIPRRHRLDGNIDE
jgi:hypothetical protein